MPRLDISVAVFPGFSLVRINLEVDGYRVLMFPIHGISQRIHSGSRDNVNRNVKRVYHFINIIFVLNGGKNCKRMQILLHEQLSLQLHQKELGLDKRNRRVLLLYLCGVYVFTTCFSGSFKF